jgi:hypothetical protein
VVGGVADGIKVLSMKETLAVTFYLRDVTLVFGIGREVGPLKTGVKFSSIQNVT